MSDNNQPIEWYLARDGQQHGPINETELQKVIEFGYLKPTDLVWRQGMADWAPAATILPQTATPEAGANNVAAPAETAPSPAEARPAEARPAEAPAPHVRLEPEPMPATLAPRAAEPAVPAPQQHAPQHAQQAYPAPQHVAAGGAAHGYGYTPGSPQRDTSVDRQPAARHQPSGPGASAPHSASPMQPGGQYRGQPQPYPHPVSPGPQAGYPRQAEPAPQWDARPGRPEPAPPGPRQGAAAPQPGGYQPQPMRPGQQPAMHPRQPHPPEPEPELEPEERRGFPWRTAAVLVVLAGLGGGAFALHKTCQLAALPCLGAPESSSAVPVVNAPAGSGKAPATAAVQPSFSGPSNVVDQGLQRSPLWQRLKRDFPDWYQERLGEMSRLSGESRDDREIGAAMTKAVVDLRRKHHAEALAAAPRRLKSIAASFVENLTRLSRQSTAACYGFISQGETSPAVAELRSSDNKAALEAQLAVIFEAIADGRKSPQRHEQPRREDYDLLTAELAKRGWTPSDLQLFSDARSLARAAPEKVCQMVQDWFSAQLTVKDEAAQIRLLGEALKPVVAG